MKPGAWVTRLLAIALAVGITACDSVPLPGSPSHEPAQPDPASGSGQLNPASEAGDFALLTEVYGQGGKLLNQRLHDRLANGASLHPVLDEQDRSAVAGTGRPFVYFAIPPEANVAACYPASTDPDAAATLAKLGVTAQSSAWRLGMPEFDQAGGCWAQDRPNVEGMPDEQAYTTWSRYYLDAKALRPYLAQSAQQRGYKWMSVCVYTFCPQYAYDLGSDAVLLERNNDEVSGISPGLAMVRGAAGQHHDRQWGIEISTYRYWNDGPTVFDATGRLVTGWSPSMVRRNMYAAYMAGADVVLNEASDYYSKAPPHNLNPLGVAVSDFADFSLHRHPARGAPEVPIAILQDHFSGYEPQFGEFDQDPLKWYRQNPYTPGDRMLSSLLDVAYPGHQSWGTIVPNAPWRMGSADGPVDVDATQAAYRRALATGNPDPRSWEPMGNTRWGESLDVITDHARLDTLLRYRIVVLAGSGPISAGLLTDLREYVRRGGTVVATTGQLKPGLDALTDTGISADHGEADSVTWSDGTVVAEKTFGYSRITPGKDTDVVAATADGDPLIIRRKIGAGSVYLTAAMLDDTGQGGLLAAYQRLLDELYNSVATVTVDGPPLQYLVSTVGTSTVVTLINTDLGGAEWHGRLRFRNNAKSASASEWTMDTPVPSSVAAGGEVVVDATVPPFGVHVYAMQPGK
ncbi:MULTISPECIES: hypothetical protein [unclassified Mycolicibacterium]|nr:MULTISPECIES: hypothetical protein [unclassified Mycolicibacterium]MUL46256.1 hypothetical protein [Mycolicibacterium sp. CBMA 360]MUM05063.1 hypothetical protein [Mycolicibacterium sp. CBMA 213]MUM33202.1 hypothetical protein [Mycolicibacterium sp. CBMA 361]